MAFNYEYGAKIYNSTLAQKVEGASPYQNADKRVLYDRWKKPGDIAMFRRIDDQGLVYQSSRLVQKNNYIRMSSLSLTYDIPREKLARTFIERLDDGCIPYFEHQARERNLLSFCLDLFLRG